MADPELIKKYIPRKRGRPRKRPLPPEKDLQNVEQNISKLEKDILDHKAEHERYRKLMQMGMVTFEGTDYINRMKEIEILLSDLRIKRSDLKSIVEIEADKQRRKQMYKDTDGNIPNNIIPNPACPIQCRDLISDRYDCEKYCAVCGAVHMCYPFESTLSRLPSAGETFTQTRKSAGYKPHIHFSEIIDRFQGGRHTSLASQEIVDKIMDYVKRYKYPLHKVDPSVVKFFLKRMQDDENVSLINKPNKQSNYKRFTDYYKYASEIAHRISGIPLPYMIPMQEEKILSLFMMVVNAYKFTPRYHNRLINRNNRRKINPNNPNYNYIFYKITQLLGYDEFLPYIPIPRNIDIIDDNDCKNWKYICEMYNWKYIPTR
jgi:hypothetical protein